MFTNTDNIIDSRDIIERIEALENEFEMKKEMEESLALGEARVIEYTVNDWALVDEDGEELLTLKEFAEECEQYSSDWEYGETLIHRNYFNEYMDEMVEDCYQLPKDLPYWMNITIDYDALEQDYISVYLDGDEYLIRSC